jgi:hypothetical protein
MAVWIEGTLRRTGTAQSGGPLPVAFKIAEVVWIRAYRVPGDTTESGCDVGLSDQSFVALNESYADILAKLKGTTGP